MERYLTISITSMTIAVMLFSIGSLLTHKNERKDHLYFLATFLGVYSCIKIDELFMASEGYMYLPDLMGIMFPMKLFLAPVIYFYARSITSKQSKWLMKRDFTALIAPTVSFCIALPFYLLPSTEKIALMSGDLLKSDQYKLAILGCQLGLCLFIAVSLYYLVASFKLLSKNVNKAQMLFSRVDDRCLKWLLFVLVLLTFGWFSYGITEIWSFMGNTPRFLNIAMMVIELTMISLIAFFGLKQNPVGVCSINHVNSYQHSSLGANELDAFAEKLEYAMQNEKLFQNPDLSLRLLSDHVGISQNNISETFSRHFNKNFFDYVNGFRVSLACDLLSNNDLSIITVAMQVGFNSRSTFNSAFKKFTNETPTGFRKRKLNTCIKTVG